MRRRGWHCIFRIMWACAMLRQCTAGAGLHLTQPWHTCSSISHLMERAYTKWSHGGCQSRILLSAREGSCYWGNVQIQRPDQSVSSTMLLDNKISALQWNGTWYGLLRNLNKFMEEKSIRGYQKKANFWVMKSWSGKLLTGGKIAWRSISLGSLGSLSSEIPYHNMLFTWQKQTCSEMRKSLSRKFPIYLKNDNDQITIILSVWLALSGTFLSI